MISLADLLAWLGDPTGDDDLLTALEARAVDIVQEETERYFGTTASFTEYFIGDGTNVLYLKEAPSTVTSVYYRSYPGDDWTEIVEGDDDGFEIRDPVSISGTAALIRKGGYTWLYGYEYRVIYPFGYTAGSEPGEIRQAVLDLVALKYGDRTRQGLQSERIGDYSYTTLANAIGQRDLFAIPGLMRTLARWRRQVTTMA